MSVSMEMFENAHVQIQTNTNTHAQYISICSQSPDSCFAVSQGLQYAAEYIGHERNKNCYAIILKFPKEFQGTIYLN